MAKFNEYMEIEFQQHGINQIDEFKTFRWLYFNIPQFEEDFYGTIVSQINETNFKIWIDGIYEFIPYFLFGKGSMIDVKNDAKNKILTDIYVTKRYNEPARKQQFNQLEINWHNDKELSINIPCSIVLTKEEFEWIKVGSIPRDMDDKIIMFFDDNQEINIFHSWGGTGLFKAKVVELKDGNWLINNLIARKMKNDRGNDYLVHRFESQIGFHLDYLKLIKASHVRTIDRKANT